MSRAGDIRPGPPREGVAALLSDCGLPSSDLSDGQMRHFFYAGPAPAPAGVVGLELCSPHALLRSLAVRETHRGTGLGIRLMEHAERHAQAQGVRTMYLLTTTAEGFFRRRGYVIASRDEAPPSVRETREFAEICPASSVFMFKQL